MKYAGNRAEVVEVADLFRNCGFTLERKGNKFVLWSNEFDLGAESEGTLAELYAELPSCQRKFEAGITAMIQALHENLVYVCEQLNLPKPTLDDENFIVFEDFVLTARTIKRKPWLAWDIHFRLKDVVKIGNPALSSKWVKQTCYEQIANLVKEDVIATLFKAWIERKVGDCLQSKALHDLIMKK